MTQPNAPDVAGPEALREIERQVSQAASLDEVVLPPYPAVALRVQRAVARDASGAAEVARIIGADAALAADVMRCASSAYYRRGGTVTNLTQALTRIGAQQALRLAFTCVLAGRAHATGRLAALRRRIWIDALASAAVCEELARLRRGRTDEAFTLGLVHDFGKLVAVWRLEALLEQAAHRGLRAPLATWAELVERQHVALGLVLAARWGLAPLAAQIIETHHGAPGPCQDPALLEIVRTSDRVVALLGQDVGVAPAALAAIPGLAEAEQRAIAGVIERLPELLAAFEPSSTPVAATEPPPSEAAVEAQPVATFPVRPAFEVSVRVAGRRSAYSAVAVGETALVVEGRDPIASNRLVSATLPCGSDSLTMWALPQGSRARAGSHHVELRPFGLDATARQRWRGLVATATCAA